MKPALVGVSRGSWVVSAGVVCPKLRRSPLQCGSQPNHIFQVLKGVLMASRCLKQKTLLGEHIHGRKEAISNVGSKLGALPTVTLHCLKVCNIGHPPWMEWTRLLRNGIQPSRLVDLCQSMVLRNLKQKTPVTTIRSFLNYSLCFYFLLLYPPSVASLDPVI